MRVLAAAVLVLVSATASAAQQAEAARSARPVLNPAAALPVPGSALAAFTFPQVDASGSLLTGRAVRGEDLRGAPTVLALWSSHCPHQGDFIRALAAVASEYRPRGVRVVVLADDPVGPELTAALDTMPWARGVDAIASANWQLAAHFDRSREAPPDSRFRAEFVLPSVLLVDAGGRIVRRAWSDPRPVFRTALDSLLARAPGAP